ncbi:Gamma-butyrobetaine dioxygenase, variant 2 [Globodera pallida]|nr:Gamma-butyrobetaine dioxygenase, variant 2 [Globodera pallida]
MFGLKTARNLQKYVQVEWEDGLLAKFSYVWLRDNTRRRPSLVHLDLNTRPQEIKCSREALEVQWPPFIASRYTSNFLRDNAFYSSVKGLCSTYRVRNMREQLEENSPLLDDPLNGNLLSVVDARMQMEEGVELGKCYWGEEAQEPGTIWPHLLKVPSIVAVDTLSGPAKLSFVDVERVLSEMRERHPKQLVFLGTCVLEYSEGPFFSTHPIVRIDDQGLVLPVCAILEIQRHPSGIVVRWKEAFLNEFWGKSTRRTRIRIEHLVQQIPPPRELGFEVRHPSSVRVLRVLVH